MTLLQQYLTVRLRTEDLCSPLMTDDYGVQPTGDVSPPKWHLAHTTWFFERFVLSHFVKGHVPIVKEYDFIFNSYYETVGAHWQRSRRGLLSRPCVEEIYRYRKTVDSKIAELLTEGDPSLREDLQGRVTLGLHHEQQHQELLLTDIKSIFWNNYLRPQYQKNSDVLNRGQLKERSRAPKWHHHTGGLIEIGADCREFTFDNECPRHSLFLQPFQINANLVTNQEYLDFINDGGYRDPQWWLSDGWDILQSERWEAPLYWEKRQGSWHQFTLQGLEELNPQEPVSHVSYFEADAYARWAGARLPLESEWELIATELNQRTYENSIAPLRFAEQNVFRPQIEIELAPLLGNLWQWTSSPYAAYPGFEPLKGSLGEYNGKFMCNQFVLRGGSYGTPRNHFRLTYRNFFKPTARWQFTGFRLAKNGE